MFAIVTSAVRPPSPPVPGPFSSTAVPRRSGSCYGSLWRGPALGLKGREDTAAELRGKCIARGERWAQETDAKKPLLAHCLAELTETLLI